MTRKKKGLTPKRKPVVRRVGTKEEREAPNLLWRSEPLIVTNKEAVRYFVDEPLTPSRWSRVVGWVRNNPIDTAIAGLGFAVAGGIIAVLL